MRFLKPVLLVGAVALMLIVMGSCTVRQYGFPVSEAAVSVGAGFRYSAYGPDYDPGPQYWLRVGQEMAARFPVEDRVQEWTQTRLPDGTPVRP